MSRLSRQPAGQPTPWCVGCNQAMPGPGLLSRWDRLTPVCHPCVVFEEEHAGELIGPGTTRLLVPFPATRLTQGGIVNSDDIELARMTLMEVDLPDDTEALAERVTYLMKLGGDLLIEVIRLRTLLVQVQTHAIELRDIGFEGTGEVTS